MGTSPGAYNTKTLAEASNRLELNNVFFIPLPGPKMIWQFGGLPYDYSIDYGGRLSENQSNGTTLNLYSTQGCLIKSIQGNGIFSIMTLNDLKTGIYILKLKTQFSSETVKIIKN